MTMSEPLAIYEVTRATAVLMQCPLAGFQFYGGEQCWGRIRAYDRLVLRREPGNRDDPRAITVEWQGTLLGYVPREANYALSQMMDRGERVEAVVKALRPGSDPWKRVMIEVAWVPAAAPAPEAASPSKAKPEVPELLVRSLVNRVFGPMPPAGAFEWVGERAGALALTGVELPSMLPFLRLVHAEKSVASTHDPLPALAALLNRAGIEPAAWKRLPRWRFLAFEAMGPAWLKPIPVARFANLLLRLDLQPPPARDFAGYALQAVLHRPAGPNARLDFERHPLWFMRALERRIAAGVAAGQEAAMRLELRICLDWLLDARPSPDANQQHAGWEWIAAQAHEYRRARRVALAEPWSVPLPEMTFGPWWVVPLSSRAQLAAEAAAMKNCLEDYEDDCRAGTYVVFSIRDALTGKPEACLSASRDSPDEPWEMDQLAGKMNAPVREELLPIAKRVLQRLNAPTSASAARSATP